MDYSVKSLLELFNNGELEVEKFFNDYETFFSILKRRNLLDQVDPINGVDSSDWQNEYLLWLYENGYFEKYRYWISKMLEDVVFDENGKAYLEIKDRGELSKLFCDNRRTHLSRNTVENILSGESEWYDWYDNTTDNVYRDVIEEFNKENLEIFKKRMVEELKGQNLSPETELMEQIASSQGHIEFWELNDENVAEILDDEESMNELLRNQLSEIERELYSIHSSSYNSAYEYEIYENIFSSLNEYFEGRGEWLSKPHPYKKETTIEYFRIPFLNFEELVNGYLQENKTYGSSGTLENHGYFLSLMSEDNFFDCLSVDVPDYPSFSKVDENINLYFHDYF